MEHLVFTAEQYNVLAGCAKQLGIGDSIIIDRILSGRVVVKFDSIYPPAKFIELGALYQRSILK